MGEQVWEWLLSLPLPQRQTVLSVQGDEIWISFLIFLQNTCIRENSVGLFQHSWLRRELLLMLNKKYSKGSKESKLIATQYAQLMNKTIPAENSQAVNDLKQQKDIEECARHAACRTDELVSKVRVYGNDCLLLLTEGVEGDMSKLRELFCDLSMGGFLSIDHACHARVVGNSSGAQALSPLSWQQMEWFTQVHI